MGKSKIEGFVEELVKHAKDVVPKVAVLFRHGRLLRFLEEQAFQRFVDRWTDRTIHGRVPGHRRPGYALRAADMGEIAHGLLAPKFAYLTHEDLPQPNDILEAFLTDLVARNIKEPKHVDAVVKLITCDFRGPDGVASLGDHCVSLEEIRQRHPTIFAAATLGDFPTGHGLATVLSDRVERHQCLRALARQRILWDACDVHRIAALGRSAPQSLKPDFLKPLLRSGTANEYLALLEQMGRTTERLYGALDRTRRHDRDVRNVRLQGPRGHYLEALEPPAQAIEESLDTQEAADVLKAESIVRHRTAGMVEQFSAIRTDPNRSEQQSLFQWHYADLSPIAALFVTAYRFAEDEMRMTAIIADPDQAGALSLTEPLWPQAVTQALRVRGRNIVAAYRPAVLRDALHQKYQSENAKLVEQSAEDAQNFITVIATRNDLAPKQRWVARQLDLAHWARAGKVT